MSVTVEPLAIGNIDGPRVWIVVRRAGTHLDIEEAPDYVKDEFGAKAWAAYKWNVPTFDVAVKPVQVVEIES